MAKINDTTLFPVATPAAADMLLGTDVSNTSNSADGETVNFTIGSLFAASATPGSGKLPKEGLGGLLVGAVSGTPLSVIDLDVASEVAFFGFLRETGTGPVTIDVDIAFSADNGATYGTAQNVLTFSVGNTGDSVVYSGGFNLTVNLVDGSINAVSQGSTALLVATSTLTVPSGCNAVRLLGGPDYAASVFVFGGRT